MSSFFTLPASQRKRKRSEQQSSSHTSRRPRTSTKTAPQTSRRDRQRTQDKQDDESISGSDSDASSGGARQASPPGSSSGEDEEETAAQRRLKLATRYLDNIRAEVSAANEPFEAGFDAADVDRELIAARVKQDIDEEKGRLFRHIAGSLDLGAATSTFFGADSLSVNAVAVCVPYIYTASKDMRLVKWKLPPALTSPGTIPKPNGMDGIRKKPKMVAITRGKRSGGKDKGYQHHSAAILCAAASADGKMVVTGGADKKMIVWDAATLKPMKVFQQHRDSVTGLAFRGNTNQLFSASKDRSVKVWSLDELAYVETLYGHQDEVVDVAAIGGSQERCISVGARDRTARLWKVIEENQLIFRGGGSGGKRGNGHKDDPKTENPSSVQAVLESDPPSNGDVSTLHYNEGSLDRVIQLSSQLFVTGSDSGALSLFSLSKKKALHIVPLAHGLDPAPSPTECSAETNPLAKSDAGPTPRWITALACVPFTDLFVSGSWDGCLRIWRISEDQKRIEAIGRLTGNSAAIDDPADGQAMSGNPRRGMKIVNDISVIELGERGKHGVCIVAAVGNQTRLGRWQKLKGKNGAFLFHIPNLPSSMSNRE